MGVGGVPRGFSDDDSLLLSRLAFFSVHGAVGTGRGDGPSLTHGGRNVVLCAGFEALASSFPAGMAFVNTLVTTQSTISEGGCGGGASTTI
jgi:hypothetical protein